MEELSHSPTAQQEVSRGLAIPPLLCHWRVHGAEPTGAREPLRQSGGRLGEHPAGGEGTQVDLEGQTETPQQSR